jgi:hypothetical protein
LNELLPIPQCHRVSDPKVFRVKNLTVKDIQDYRHKKPWLFARKRKDLEERPVAFNIVIKTITKQINNEIRLLRSRLARRNRIKDINKHDRKLILAFRHLKELVIKYNSICHKSQIREHLNAAFVPKYYAIIKGKTFGPYISRESANLAATRKRKHVNITAHKNLVSYLDAKKDQSFNWS